MRTWYTVFISNLWIDPENLLRVSVGTAMPDAYVPAPGGRDEGLTSVAICQLDPLAQFDLQT